LAGAARVGDKPSIIFPDEISKVIAVDRNWALPDLAKVWLTPELDPSVSKA